MKLATMKNIVNFTMHMVAHASF